MAVAITASDLICSLGDADETFEALLAAEQGVTALRADRADAAQVGVTHAYQIDEAAQQGQVTRWLERVVSSVARTAGLVGSDARVAVVVGTGLREHPSAERWRLDGADLAPHELHFTSAVRRVLPDVVDVITIANACAAGGYALAIGQDMLELDEADAVIVAGCDGVTASMLALIGRGGGTETRQLQPFEQSRRGVLLGEGAAAVVLQRVDHAERGSAVVRGVGLVCDAKHETAPDRDGIVACMRDAHERAGVQPSDIDLILAHGTGTALNDPVEASALAEVLGERAAGVPVTAIKAGTGHTSGSSALMSLIVAIRSLVTRLVPPIGGLSEPIPEAASLRLVRGEPLYHRGSIAQINSFGFGGVNAVTVIEVKP